MDDGIKDLKEYLNRLPASAREVILSADWHSRASDIGRKYSLEPSQINSLEYEILFVLLGMEADGDFVENIKKQLNISDLLANQIDEEVNSRVFAYLLDLIEKKEPSVSKASMSKMPFDMFEKSSTMSSRVLDTDKEDAGVPEIKPDNLPQKITVPKYVPPDKPAPVVPNNLPGQVISEQKNQSPAQEQPVSRVPLDTEVPAIQKPEPVEKARPNIVDNKLNNVVSGVEDKPPQKYAFDPFREPIE